MPCVCKGAALLLCSVVDAYCKQITPSAAARAAFDSATSRYQQGLTNHLTVLTSLQALQRAELNQLSAHRNLITSRVQLHQSLGGAWIDSLPQLTERP